MSYVSHADLGGQLGYGPVVDEPEGELFHRAWEPRVLAVNLAVGAQGRWNIDMSRRYRETLPDYADLSYYQIWMSALERMVIDRGLVGADELVAGRSLRPTEGARPPLRASEVAAVLAYGRPASREIDEPARFTVGDRVRISGERPDHHTRVPGYVAGAVGTIERLHGAHVFADTHAHELGEQPQWLYTVVFDAGDLWDDATPGQTVSVDAWESYLSPVVASDSSAAEPA
jgi:nitrile hydratase